MGGFLLEGKMSTMKISLHEIAIREVVENYVDNAEEGWLAITVGNIRPKYQREFVYDDKGATVIDTIKNFPLNVMYWVKMKMVLLKF